MKERPILFSAPMVNAILADRKTMTRRIVKDLVGDDDALQIECGLYHPTVIDRHGEEQPGEEAFGAHTIDGRWATKCPHGRPGDKLWVRETFCDDWEVTDGVRYRADGDLPIEMFDAGCKWGPSIFMPRKHCRITLEVTGVRVERLQDISYTDCLAEGIDRAGRHEPAWRDAFMYLWDSINAKRAAWESNPWCWAIEFKRITP